MISPRPSLSRRELPENLSELPANFDPSEAAKLAVNLARRSAESIEKRKRLTPDTVLLRTASKSNLGYIGQKLKRKTLKGRIALGSWFTETAVAGAGPVKRTPDPLRSMHLLLPTEFPCVSSSVPGGPARRGGSAAQERSLFAPLAPPPRLVGAGGSNRRATL